jgi:tRNA uridine 5-carbamoylmethylation protein Kti12
MGPKATRMIENVRKGNFWIGLVSGGVGSLIAFASFFFVSGQRLQAHTNEVNAVKIASTTNTTAIKSVNANIYKIKTDIAVIQQKQTAQKETVDDINEAQKEQTKMIQQILIELKK